MGEFTSKHPKCMTEISARESILSRQLKMLVEIGIEEVVMTTGPFAGSLVRYCHGLELPLHITFVQNPAYAETNYIYSIYCARQYLNDDILLIHGDMVFENQVLDAVMESERSCMAVSSEKPLPEKDFKARIENGRIAEISVDTFENALAAYPLYKIWRKDWEIWLNAIVDFCDRGECQCYAENAFNCEAGDCALYPLDVRSWLCSEIDTQEDLTLVSARLEDVENRTAYLCFSTDLLHRGHISLIKKASRLGKVIIGVLTDEAVLSYKRFPLMPYPERKAMFESISFVSRVVEQDTLSYEKNINRYRPTYVVHGDDWKTGVQKPIRDGVVAALAVYGGQLVEYPYMEHPDFSEIERRSRADLALPDLRRGRLQRMIEMKGLVTAIETHSGLTGLIAEKTTVFQNGEAHQFDAMWISSLCDSTAKGKPDIELVDMTSRFRTIDEVMDVTTKPIIFDGDTGGLTEHFVYTVRTLERMGVSMVVIEDKRGLKKNSLFGTDVVQEQDTIGNFCAKISAGKKAQKTSEFMICARIESLILEKGLKDAMERAVAYVGAGADAIMIHSRKKDPEEIFEFVETFRQKDNTTPLVVVPTSFNMVTEEEFKARGVNIVIYANQLTRSSFPAMQSAAKTILQHHRAKECDEMCMPIGEIISLIPEDV